MSNSFFIYSPDYKSIDVNSLHVNLWFLSQNVSYIELGILLNVSVDELLKMKKLSLEIYTPFTVKKQEVSSLYEQLEKEKLAKLVFNDEVRSKNMLAEVGCHRPFTYIFKSDKKLAIFDPVITQADANQIKLEIDLESLNQDLVMNDFPSGEVSIYCRIRFKVDCTNSTTIINNREILREQAFFDFRINELRALPDNLANQIYDKILYPKRIHIFLIKPCRFRVVLDSDTLRKYVRLLENSEDGWKEYLTVLKKIKEKLLVYHWVKETDSNSNKESFDMLVALDSESPTISRKISLSVFLAIISIVLIAIPIVGKLDQFGPVWQYLVTISRSAGAIIGAIMIGLVTSAVYDYFKLLWNSSRVER